MSETIDDLIRRAGGAEVISAASQLSRKPVTPDAVRKWRRNGIPDEHWRIFISAGVELERIFQANEALRCRCDPAA